MQNLKLKIQIILGALLLFGISSAAPTVSFNRFTNDVSTDNQPTITGIATNTASAIVTLECRVDGGAFTTATPLDGQFDSNTEAFSWTPPQPLTRGVNSHEVEVLGTSGSYSFYVIGDRPEIGLLYRGGNLFNGDVIDKNPVFNITVISNKPPVTAPNLSLTVDPNNAYLFRANFAPTLNDGKYDLKIEATDNSGRITTKEVIDLVVQNSADLAVQGIPLNYPNPFNPNTGSTNISYTLSKPADITLTIYDLMGNQILKKTIGSKAGYNEVAWDGRDAGGTMAGNGILLLAMDECLEKARPRC